MAKSIHSWLSLRIPEHLAVYGEWVFAVHSLKYDKLPAYFLVFNVLDIPQGMWLSHSDTEDIASSLGLPMVPVLAKFVPDSEESLRILTETLSREPSRLGPEREGVVVKLASECLDADFSMSVAKWVRPDHPKDPINHWMTKPVERQRLA
jgi:ATP-dependent RNA circularization protein (DNA/RNA ligase family)